MLPNKLIPLFSVLLFPNNPPVIFSVFLFSNKFTPLFSVLLSPINVENIEVFCELLFPNKLIELLFSFFLLSNNPPENCWELLFPNNPPLLKFWVRFSSFLAIFLKSKNDPAAKFDPI